MTLQEFLAALPALTKRYRWYEDDLGMLRSSIVGAAGETHSTITALCEAWTGTRYDPLVDWDKAARALGLTLTDAAEITSAEDNDRYADQEIARRLRCAVGVEERHEERDQDEAVVSQTGQPVSVRPLD